MKYHVRRADRELTDPTTLKQILTDTRYVTIALTKDNTPYLVSLSHLYDESANCIYFHCAKEGRKLDYMKENPAVWGQALIDRGYVDGECNHLYASAMFGGTVELIADIQEKRRILGLIYAHQEKKPQPGAAPDPHLARIGNDAEMTNVTVGRILIQELTGKVSKDFKF